MVSGSKNDSRIKKKGKEKLVFAKDPKQAMTAIIVVAVFVINGIYMLIKYLMEQNASSAPASQQSGSSFPTVLIVILVAALVGGVIFALSKNPKLLAGLTSGIAGSTSSKVSSSAPKGKDKGKMIFAKDPKQAMAAVIVLVIFLGNGIYMLTKYLMEQNAQNNTTQQAMNNPASQNTEGQSLDELSSLDQEQGTNPESINNDANNIYSETMRQRGEQVPPQEQRGYQANAPVGAEGDVEIMTRRAPQRRGSTKMVSIVVTNTGRDNPFMPAGEGVSHGSFSYLPPPPETLPTNTDATKVMNTTISGILYDKYSPSAILNIEGADYLVKKGDIINHYRVLSIGRNNVIVQLGNNIYQAGVGELLTLTNLNYNTIANLNKKFGGNEVSINVRKKGY